MSTTYSILNDVAVYHR